MFWKTTPKISKKNINAYNKVILNTHGNMNKWSSLNMVLIRFSYFVLIMIVIIIVRGLGHHAGSKGVSVLV